MDLRFLLLILSFASTISAVRLTSDGYACRDACSYSKSKDYYSCHYKYLSSWTSPNPALLNDDYLSTKSDYCSPSNGYDYKNRRCTSPCGFNEGTNYQWCHVKVGSTWGYCSIESRHPGTNLADFNYRGELCENDCAKYSKNHYQCHNGLDGWQPCSPAPGRTSEGKACHGPCRQKGKPNLKDIKRYSFCFTDALHSDWGYCSNKKGNVVSSTAVTSRSKHSTSLQIEPPVVTWGRWKQIEMCPNGTVVVGFELKSQMYMGNRYSPLGLIDTLTTLGTSPLNDDTGLNGIGLLCSPPQNGTVSSSPSITRIRSGFGNLGEWGPDTYCGGGGRAIGFKLKVQSPQGASDDAGATNFNLICNQNEIPDPAMEYEPGEWSQYQKCPKDQFLCGIKTKIYDDGGNEDWVGLTDVELYCCHMMEPRECTPEEKFDTILTYRNEFNVTQKHTKEVTIGVEHTEGSEMNKKIETTKEDESGGGIGIELQLKAGFEKKIGMSTIVGFDWSRMSSTVWTRQHVDKFELEIPPKTQGTLLQVVGTCGNYRVRTTHIVAKSEAI